MSQPIELFGGLNIDRRKNAAGKTVGARVTCEFTAPSLVWHADEKAIAGEVADAIAETIRGNLLRGLAPDGTPLPEASVETLIRREYRVEQDARGGLVTERITDQRERTRGRRRWNGRFRAAKLGDQHPIPGSHLFGVESGLLARSVVAVTDGAGWKVFFAAIRSKLDRSGSGAAMRVFRRIDIWNRAAMAQPRVQEALRNVQKNLFASSAAKALAQAQAAVSNLAALGQDLEDDG